MQPSPLEMIRRPEVIRDPYPYYAGLREETPVLRDRNGRWFVSRYEDAFGLLTHPNLSSNRLQRDGRSRFGGEAQIRELFDALTLQILFLDPPHHTRLRGLVSKAFTPSRVQQMRGAIQSTVDALLDAAMPAGQLDVIEQLAVPLPLRVICDMLAIPERDRANLKRWSSDYAIFLGGAPLLPSEVMLQCAASLAEFMQYFRELGAQRRAQPGDDLLSALLLASSEDDAIDRDVVSATAVLLITAGHETTTNLIGNGLLALLNQPQALEQLRCTPALWPSALEELLRFDSPVQFVARRVASELTLREHRIPQDDIVFVLTGAANRDPDRFSDPDRLDLARPQNRHLSFGQGPHYCIGAALSRLEAEIALSSLFDRSQQLRVLQAEPSWLPNPALRGLTRLPVSVDHLALVQRGVDARADRKSGLEGALLVGA